MVNPIIVVSDTTPLITLAGVGRLDLLPLLYTQVFIPQQVLEEYEKFQQPLALPDIKQQAWLKVQLAAIEPRFQRLLDDGEAAALSLAHDLQADIVLMDEQKGRRVAQQSGFQVVGVLGVLLKAKRHGLIAAIKPITDQFAQLGRYYSQALIDRALQQAGE